MKNIECTELNNIEELLENEELPVSINNEVVIMDYNEYIKVLKITDPEKAEELELAVAFKRNSDYFTEDIIKSLRGNLMEVFAKNNLSLEDFENRELINNIVSTLGYNTALHKTLSGCEFAQEFFEWYDALTYYNSDDFDGLIEEKLITKKDEETIN